jgi:hypothetical protein
MAEINVQQKSSSAIWWVIGIIALALVLWFVFGWNWGTDTGAYNQGVGALPQQSAPVADAAFDLHRIA